MKKLVYSNKLLIAKYSTTDKSNDRKKPRTYLLVSMSENKEREVEDVLDEVDEL